MTTPQLLDYVRQQLAAGVSRDDLKKTLVTQGWSEQDINEALATVETKAPAPAMPQQTQAPARSVSQTQGVPVSLVGLGGLFSNAFTIYKKQWLPLLLISAITAGISYALSFLLLGGALLGVALISVVNPLVLIGVVFAALLVFSYLMVVLGGVMLRAVSDTTQGVGGSFGWAFKHSLSLYWIYILFFLLIAGGFSLLIIPGIFFLIWFAFAPFVYATEGDKGFDAYFKSKDYVRGHFWSVVVRLIPPALIFGVIYFLPIDQLIKAVLYFLLNPFLLAYMQSLYLSAKAVRAQSTATPQKESKIAYFIVGLIGLVLPALILAALNNVRNKANDALSQLQANQEQINQALQQIQNGTSGTSTPGLIPNGANNSSGMPVIGNETYTNNAYSYSIKFPTGWLLDDTSTKYGGDASASPDAVPPDASNSFVTLNQISADVSPLTGANAMQCNTLDSCSNLTLSHGTNTHLTKTKIGTLDARLLEYDEDGSHILQLNVVKDNNLYTAIAIFDSADVWAKYEQVIRASINSFAITK